jgi:hypothetical protein
MALAIEASLAGFVVGGIANSLQYSAILYLLVGLAVVVDRVAASTVPLPERAQKKANHSARIAIEARQGL